MRQNAHQNHPQCGSYPCGSPGEPLYVVQQPKRGPRFFRFIFRTALLWALLVFASGTMISTGHPAAMHFGEALQTVTFVEPMTDWAVGEGHYTLVRALDLLSGGVDLHAVV